MMEKIRETFLKKYGVWEYILFVLGAVFTGRVGYEVIVMNFDQVAWPEIAVISFFLAVGVLLLAKPMSITDWAKKKVGMDTKK